jgi:type II secretion system protein H
MNLRRAPRLPFASKPSRRSRRTGAGEGEGAFTLVELILVMTVIVVSVSVVAPTLKNFFHGRTLDSEARRLLALTRAGQARAVSEGVPMVLWVDSQKNAYGLEAEPGYEDQDAKAENFSLASDLQVQVVNAGSASAVNATNLIHADLPQIRFLPDGGYDANSPAAVGLLSQDGTSLWLAQSRNHVNYEIRTQPN